MNKTPFCLFLLICCSAYSADIEEGVFYNSEKLEEQINAANSIRVGKTFDSFVYIVDNSLIWYKEELLLYERQLVNIVEAIAQEQWDKRWKNIKIQFSGLGMRYAKEKYTSCLGIYAPYVRVAEYPQFYDTREAAANAYKQTLRKLV
jgi:hypothetical protein